MSKASSPVFRSETFFSIYELAKEGAEIDVAEPVIFEKVTVTEESGSSGTDSA